MSSVRRRIGIVTAGGDAPGLNAAIRAVARTTIAAGDTPVGILNGWQGLLDPDDGARDLRAEDLSGILPTGGTLLGSSRTEPLADEVAQASLLDGIERLGLDALVAIGGDGTLALAHQLATHGARVVGIPKTIDRDVAATDVCIGFDSALGVVVEALDRLHTTAASHHQVMVLETMGRDAGWLAALGALAGGADVVCIPEFPTSMDSIASSVSARRTAGKLSTIVLVAEGSVVEGLDEPTAHYDRFGHRRLSLRMIGQRVANGIEAATGLEVRCTVFGYVQRGGSPVASDRLWATRLGAAAAGLARDGGADAVAVRDGHVVAATLAELTATRSLVPRDLYDLCCALG